MKADLTRSTFDKTRHYRGVRMQQGRVQLDADWNEQQDILLYRKETETLDVIGDCGGPIDELGFEIQPQAGELHIGPGRYYVHGAMCENEDTHPVNDQPDLFPDAPLVTLQDQTLVPLNQVPNGTYLAYLDVWPRHLTALEDSSIREVALGGPDTATRSKTVWQVKLAQVGGLNADLNCLSNMPEWNAITTPPDGRLSARAEPDPESTDPCIVEAGAGYRRLDNQLYRVEIHQSGDTDSATFVWSRENGSVVSRWLSKSGDDLTVEPPGKDKVLGFASGQWIELIDDTRELTGQPGTLVRVLKVVGDVITIEPGTATGTVDRVDFPMNPKVRRWDSQGETTVEVPAQNDGWLELEGGVEVRFTPGATYRTGDYWMIPARTATADVEWPVDTSGDPVEQLPHGIPHRYCHLALLEFDGAWSVLEDCRNPFPPLTEFLQLFYVSGDGQEAMPDLTDLMALVALPQPLQVGVSLGQWPVQGARVRFNILSGNGRLQQTGNTVTVTTGADGIATCDWELDATNPSQQVEVRLLNADDQPLHVPVRFTANLSVASEVAYDPQNCPDLANALTVQEAIDRLCQINRGGCCIKVVPGDDIQSAIDAVIERGGGCICLAQGVHEVNGPLRINEASNLTIHGENRSTVLWLRNAPPSDTDAPPPLGGIFVHRSRDIVLENMFVVGEGVPALLQVGSGIEANGNEIPNDRVEGLALNKLLMLNLTEIDGDQHSPASIMRMHRVGNILICQSGWVADAGLLALPETIPTEEEILEGTIKGVHFGSVRLRMDDVAIRFRDWGILAYKADQWQLENCNFGSVDFDRMDQLRSFASESNHTEDDFRLIQVRTQSLLSIPGGADSGVAVKSLWWQDGSIRSTRLAGFTSFESACVFRTEMSQGTLEAMGDGLKAVWLRETSILHNTFKVTKGSGIEVGGVFECLIRGNRISSVLTGVKNTRDASWQELLRGYFDDLSRSLDIGREGPPEDPESIFLWGLLEGLTEELRMQPLVSSLQRLLNSFITGSRVPVLFYFAFFLASRMNGGDDGDSGETPLTLPLMDLQVMENDLKTSRACVDLQEFASLGGIKLVGNQMFSSSSYGIQLNSDSRLANTHLLAFVVRTLLKTLNSFLERFDTQLDSLEGNMDETQLQAYREFSSAWQAYAKLVDRVIGGLSGDYRIEGNTISSLNTGIESNVFEVNIHQNHVTLRERRRASHNLRRLVNRWSTSRTTRPMSVALRDGAMSNMRRASRSLAGDSVLNDAESRAETANAMFSASSDVDNAEMATALSDVAIAVNTGSLEAVRETVLTLADLVIETADSAAIRVAGAGTRVVGNHALVPSDVDPDSRARGGILVWNDLEAEDASGMSVMLSLLVLLGDAGDPLLGVTETLIENNEVFGGYGHGIHINAPLEYETAPQGDQAVANLQFGLFDLQIRNNQIRGLGGAGILLDEETLCVGVTIENNRVLDCSGDADLASLTSVKGGIVFANSALCRVIGNETTRCGLMNDFRIAGIDSESVYDLTLDQNRALYNRIGVTLDDVFGDVGLNDNSLLANEYDGLIWLNRLPAAIPAAGAADDLLNPDLLDLLNWYRYRSAVGDHSRAVTVANGMVQGNRIEVPGNFPAVTIRNVRGLNFVGNRLNKSGFGVSLGALTSVQYLSLANNVMETNTSVSLILTGIVSGIAMGNVSNRTMQRVASFGLQTGLNVPPF